MRVDICNNNNNFLVVNTYHDGKYTNMLKISKNICKCCLCICWTFIIYVYANPKGSKGMFAHANNIIKYMPIDKQTSDLISPIFDFTNATCNVSQSAVLQ